MEIVKSSAGRWYVKDYDKVTNDISYETVNKIAGQCGSHRFTVSGYITFGKESDCEKFKNIIVRISNIPKKLKTFLKKEHAYDLFVLNFPKGGGETLLNAFYWGLSNEGNDFWSNLNKKYENQLQNKTVDRSGDDRSEGDRLCCRRDVIEPSTGHSGYEARARKRKNAFGSSKVYLSTRRGCVHRG